MIEKCDKVKILILHRNSFDVIGGVESTIYYMVEALKELGHTPIVLAKYREGATEDNGVCKVLRYSHSRIKFKLLFPIIPFLEYLNAKKKIREIIEREKPDFIITRDNILSYVVSDFFDNNRIVYIPLGVIKYYNAGIRKFNSLRSGVVECIRFMQMQQESYFQLKAIKKLNKVVVFSKNMRSQIWKALKAEKPVTVIHPGVSPKFYSDIFAESIRSEFGIPDNKKILLFVGRVVQEKNVRMLIDAYANSNNENTVLLIVGGGDDLAYVKNKAATLGISDKVVFAGFRRDTERFYREADLFVLPSYYESFGNVILEAMASGVPVVGFRTEEGKVLTAIDELVEDGKSGFICKEYSLGALTNAINTAVGCMNSEAYNSIKKYCADTAKTNFTWGNFMQQVLGVLKEEG